METVTSLTPLLKIQKPSVRSIQVLSSPHLLLGDTSKTLKERDTLLARVLVQTFNPSTGRQRKVDL